MSKDKRYILVKNLIASGYIIRFMQILDVIPKTVICHDLGMHHITFNKLVAHPERFTFEDSFLIASLIDVDAKVVIELIYTQCQENKSSKRKKTN